MITLMYHDVVDPGADDASGFRGKDAAIYKVTAAQFADHVAAIARATAGRFDRPCLTFDDGGVSAMRAADTLERAGLRGCFLVTADYIGTSGFLDAAQMRELDARGHIIGSHSCSHPLRMGHCPPEQLRDEWSRSTQIIGGILGHAVTVASTPGGDFAPIVALTAAEAGICELFTSEPTTADRPLHGLTLHGRFTIRRGTTAAEAAALACGRYLPRARQALGWSIRKAGKRLGGERYLQLRRRLLGQREQVVRWGDSLPDARARD